jgi:hypothetical protein
VIPRNLGATVDTVPTQGPTLPFPVKPASPTSPGSPAAAGSPSAYPALTMEQYASLRVELHKSPPERVAQTLARYRVPVEAQAALDEHWKERFDADPALRSAFLNACATYSAWLASRPADPPKGSRA